MLDEVPRLDLTPEVVMKGIRQEDPGRPAMGILEEVDVELKAILEEFSIAPVSLDNREAVEKVMVDINDRLRMAESISAILHVMRASQYRSQPMRAPEAPPDSRGSKRVVETPSMSAAPPAEHRLTPEDARRLLDSQFSSRQCLLESQKQRTLIEASTRPPVVVTDDIFVPSLQGDFLPLTGLSEVVSLLLPPQCNEAEIRGSPLICGQCSSASTPSWHKDTGEVLCEVCSGARRLTEIRRDLEGRLATAMQACEAGERALARDYEDMLACPAKMALFRLEQQRRLTIQQHGVSQSASTPVVETPPPPTLDAESLRRLRQVLALIQSTPQLAANENAVLELLAGVCGIQGLATGPSAAALLARLMAAHGTQ